MSKENKTFDKQENGNDFIVDVSASTIIKELYEALTNLLQAADDEGWINDETDEDWEEQSQARKALANVPEKYLR